MLTVKVHNLLIACFFPFWFFFQSGISIFLTAEIFFIKYFNILTFYVQFRVPNFFTSFSVYSKFNNLFITFIERKETLRPCF